MSNVYTKVTGYTDTERLSLAIDLHEDLARTIRAWTSSKSQAGAIPDRLSERRERFLLEMIAEVGGEAERRALAMAEELRDTLIAETPDFDPDTFEAPPA